MVMRKAEAFSMFFWLVLWGAAMWSAGKWWLIPYFVGAGMMFYFFLWESHRQQKKEEAIDMQEQQKLHEFIG